MLICLFFWVFDFSFLTWRIDFYMQECETKCFGETKKSFIILWFYFYGLFFFSGLFLFSFSGISAFFFLSNFFVGEGVFFGLFLLLFGVGERWFFFIIHKQIFQDFSIFLYIFLILYRHFFLWNLYSKINQGKRSKIFVSTSFLQIMTWLISFFCF